MHTELDLAAEVLACTESSDITQFDQMNYLIPTIYHDEEYDVHAYVTEKVVDKDHFVIVAFKAEKDSSLGGTRMHPQVGIRNNIYQAWYNLCDKVTTDILERTMDAVHYEDSQPTVIVTGRGLAGQLAALQAIGNNAHYLFTFDTKNFVSDYLRQAWADGSTRAFSYHTVGNKAFPVSSKGVLGDHIWFQYNKKKLDPYRFITGGQWDYFKAYMTGKVE